MKQNQQYIGYAILAIAIFVSFRLNQPKTLPNVNQTVNRDDAPDAKVVVVSTENDSKQAIQNINEFRKKSGKTPLNYSSKAYKLAVALAKDMNQYGYFDFTNPKTKTCADNMKLGFGFTNEEYLTSSIRRYVPVGANVGFETRNVSQVTKEWVEEVVSTDQNFLYPQHVAGAVGCDENKCVFLALNYTGYGKGCVVKNSQ